MVRRSRPPARRRRAAAAVQLRPAGSRRAVLKGAGKGAGSALSRRELAAPSSTAVCLMTSALLVDRSRAVTSETASSAPCHAGKTTLAHMVIASGAAVTWSPTHTGALIGQRCLTVEPVQAGRPTLAMTSNGEVITHCPPSMALIGQVGRHAGSLDGRSIARHSKHLQPPHGCGEEILSSSRTAHPTALQPQPNRPTREQPSPTSSPSPS